MRAVLVSIIFVILLSGCGSTALVLRPTQSPVAQAAAAPAAAPTQAVSATPAATTTPTKQPTVTRSPTAAPSSTPVPPTVAPSATPVPPSATPLPPTTAPQPVARVSSATAPMRIVIDAIGMDRPLVSVGLDRNNVPIVPNHDVGWYNLSARPGQGENVVLWGHVLRFKSAPNIPAPFARLKELQPGARVTLLDEAGNRYTYAVSKQVWATPDQVEYILPQGHEVVTMVSCIGDKVVVDGSVELTHRLITIAEPVE